MKIVRVLSIIVVCFFLIAVGMHIFWQIKQDVDQAELDEQVATLEYDLAKDRGEDRNSVVYSKYSPCVKGMFVVECAEAVLINKGDF